MPQALPFDVQKLTTYLESHVEGFIGPITLEKFPGGQSNPTYKVIAKSGTYVLRSQPAGKLLKSAHAVDREYQVLDALENSNVPVAKVFHLCTNVNITGAMFYLMEYCDGSVYWSASLVEIDTNERRAQMYDAMNKTLVALHSVDIKGCGLGDYGNGKSLMVGPDGGVIHQAGNNKEIFPIEIDFALVRRNRERGLHGLGQPLKSFRDNAITFELDKKEQRLNSKLNELGKLEVPK